MGVSKITDLPDYDQVRKDIDSFKQSTEAVSENKAVTNDTIEE
jgi:hypothetical protein